VADPVYGDDVVEGAGMTTPTGTWRELDASWAYRPKEAVSNGQMVGVPYTR
jgi:hypothetical protein